MWENLIRTTPSPFARHTSASTASKSTNRLRADRSNTMATKAQLERAEAIETLLNSDHLKPGDVVYTTTLHTSRSGMSRTIRATLIRDNAPRDISFHVAKATGSNFDRDRYGVKVGGCGMDMGFHLVYGLSRSLFPEGHDCTGVQGCPSNDHNNDYSASRRMAKGRLLGDEWATPSERDNETWTKIGDLAETIRREELGHRPGRHHSDGGYALKQVWL